MSRTLSKDFVINDLRPRFHRLARGGELRARHPFAAHLLNLDHDDVARRAVEDEARAEVDAADLGRLLVDAADEAQLVVAVDAHLLAEPLPQSVHETVPRADVPA